MDKQELSYIALNAILSSELLLQCMEELKNTEVYRRELKNLCNQMERQLLSYTKDTMPLVWGIDDHAMYTTMDYQKQLIGKLVKYCNPTEIGVFNEILELYLRDREGTMKQLNIVTVDSSEHVIS